MSEIYKGEKGTDIDLQKDLLYFQKEQLFSLAQKFILDNKIECPETIYQCDHVILNARELIEKMCEIVGYYEDNKLRELSKTLRENTKKINKSWIVCGNPDPELIKQLGQPKFDETLGLYIWEKK